MNTDQIKHELSLEINRLQQARDVLAGINPILPKRRGRPSKALLALLHAGAEEPQTAPPRAARKTSRPAKAPLVASTPAKKVAAKVEPVTRRAYKKSAAKKTIAKKTATLAAPGSTPEPATAKRKYARRVAVEASAPAKTRTKKAVAPKPDPAEPPAISTDAA